MANDNRIVLDYDETANLDPQKLEEAKKKFQETAYGIVRDVTPVVGEAQSYKYALQDAETLKKAARGDEGFKDMTPIEALGYVGLTALGVAGMTPIVGPYARKAASGIRALMPKRGQGTTARSPINRNVRNAVLRDDLYPTFIRNLPEYRRDPNNVDNIREFLFLPNERRAELLILRNRQEGGEPQLFYDTYPGGDRYTGEAPQRFDLREPELENLSNLSVKRAEDNLQIKKNEEKFNIKANINSSRALTVPKEPLTFGKGLRSNKDGTVREYLGSAAFDEVQRSGNAIGTPKEWMGYLKGLRQKGIKAEELSDSGLLIFGKGGEPVGGDIYNLMKENPKIKITKGEILASLETNPAFRLKVKDYVFPINTDEILNIYPTFSKLSKDTESMILRKSTNMENVAERSNLTAITEGLNQDRAVFNDLANRLSTTKGGLSSLEQNRKRLTEVLDSFNDNEKLLTKNLIDQYDKAIELAKKGLVATKRPKHVKSFPGGGFDYREKLLNLDESIPGNSVARRVYSVHFNDSNNITFVRYDTRGVDNYGDTYFMVELQSDPHQDLAKLGSNHFKDFKKGKSNIDPSTMVRKNPYAKNIRLRVKKREIQDTLDEMSELQNINKERPLSPPELNRLNELTTKLKVQESELNRMPARQGKVSEDFGEGSYAGSLSLYDRDNKSYDYFPMGNEATWVKASVRSLVHDARKNNKRYIALAPADFYQLDVNNKAKIEQFYGLGNKELPEKFLNDDATAKNFLNIDGKGFGKYRIYEKKLEPGVDEANIDALPTNKLGGMAVVPKAMKDVANEIGGTFTSKRVYHTDPNKPYKILDSEKNIPKYSFKKKYEMDEFFDNLNNSYNYEKVKIEADDPRNFVESIVIDLQGSRKKAKMKAYKFGGLVEVDRSNFAPLF